jgi:hypothetical protein
MSFEFNVVLDEFEFGHLLECMYNKNGQSSCKSFSETSS